MHLAGTAALWIAVAPEPSAPPALEPWAPAAGKASVERPADPSPPHVRTTTAPAPAVAPDRPAYVADTRLSATRAPTLAPLPAPPGPAPVHARRLVFVNLYGVSLSVLVPLPSLDFSFFLGGTLRPRPSRRGSLWRTAVGYQFTLSLGGADLTALVIGTPVPEDESILLADPFLYHRHHVTAHGFGGRRSRLYYSMGGGLWFYERLPTGLEAEGRLGFRFGARDHHRASGVVGGHLRLGGRFGGYPVPTAGVFIGYMIF